MKKGQLSINTIVVTIIALAVLITLILFFTGKFADFSQGVSEFDQEDTTSEAGCQVACNLEKSGAGTPFTDKPECAPLVPDCDLPEDSGQSSSPSAPAPSGSSPDDSGSTSETIS
ncbi:hypothetical protein HOE39_02450 [Candidatus Woesearchaeota archaeon]|jgi:hypothetical protein|nr:hypothetical protein [Candidatus Woesearchaeota archaeon]